MSLPFIGLAFRFQKSQVAQSPVATGFFLPINCLLKRWFLLKELYSSELSTLQEIVPGADSTASHLTIWLALWQCELSWRITT
jgi:hypothetical protein